MSEGPRGDSDARGYAAPTGAALSQPVDGPGPVGAGPGYGTFGDGEEVHLRDYWRVAGRRRWTVIVVFLLAVGAAAAWVLAARPVFTAMATLRIEREEPRVVKFEGVVRADPDESYYQTQYNILRSRSLADRVIERLALDRHPEFADVGAPDGPWRSILDWLGRERAEWQARAAALLGGEPALPAAGDPSTPAESPITRAFLARLEVRPITTTRLVEVRFDSHHPDLAARAVNALAEAFIEENLQHKRAATSAAQEFLAGQMEQAREKLEKSEDRLNRFLGATGIQFLDRDNPGERQALVTQQLETLSSRLLAARAERFARESAARQAASQDPASLPAVLANPVIGQLKESLVKLEVERRDLARVFAPGFEDVRARQLDDNIRELRRRIAEETDNVVRSLEADYQAARRVEESLRGAVQAQQRLTRRLGDQMVQYSLLRREVDTNREIFTSLLSRLKETGVSAALLTSNVAVVDHGKVPVTPSKPRKARTLLVAGILGLMGGIGLAFVREHLDTTLKDVREVESALGVPALAMVPSWRRFESRRGRRGRAFALVAHSRAGSVFAEAFRALRTSLLFALPERPPRTILVTSLHVDDGKTSLATNLGIVLAQLGVGDVLLVDADMRRSRLHALLDVPQAPGLSAVLTGQARLSDVVVATRIPHLYVVPAGEPPANPAELLSSARLAEALDLAAPHFRQVVIDSPPLFGVSDAMALAPRVDAVLLVLRQGRTTREAARHAVRGLASIHARLLGVVLNDVDLRRSEIGIDYAGYYAYGVERRSAA